MKTTKGTKKHEMRMLRGGRRLRPEDKILSGFNSLIFVNFRAFRGFDFPLQAH
jgi:hypothetical protein